MQKIISHGDITKRKDRIICDNCKCDFIYSADDVRVGASIHCNNLVKYVMCPECLDQIEIDCRVRFVPYYLTKM